MDSLRIKEADVVPGVCPYCAVGCAQLIYVKDNTDIEGHPDTSGVGRSIGCD